ncbi:hypothetical protein JCM8097_006199 [Rhodosporidiobolus ruineniae]
MATPKPRFFLGKSKPGAVARSTPGPSGLSSSRSTPSAASKPPPPPADAPIAPDGDTRLAEYSSPDDVCPVCKNDRYLNPKLRLMVSKCYHKMCESCLDRLFSLGPEPCPICGQTIRKNQFQPQMFQNLEVQKEVAVRRRMAKIFNKRPEDFPTPDAYNDYLESYESLTFSLIHSIGSDLAATEAKIRAYEAQNRQSIEDNEERGLAEREQHEEAERRERERRERERRRAIEEMQEEEREKEEERKRVMAELESGTLSPTEILAASSARTRSSALKRSSARDGTPSSANGGAVDTLGNLGIGADNAFAKMQYLSSLSASATGGAGGGSGAATPGEGLPALDPLSDLRLYTAATPYISLPLPSHSSSSASSSSAFAPAKDLGALAREKERDDAAGFRAEEVWEKAVRCAVGAGLWEVPLGWAGGAASGGGGGAMEVEVV